MDTSSLGKWAWLIGLVILVVWGIVKVFAPDMLSADLQTTIGTLCLVLAFLGGIFYLSGMKDRTGYLITAAALGWFAGGGGTMFVDQLGSVVSGALGGAAAAAGAGAAGVLLVVVYEWIMSYSK